MFISQRESQRFITKCCSGENLICRLAVINFRAAIKKNLANFMVSMFSRKMQSWISAVVDFINIGTAHQQKINSCDVFLPDGVMKRAKSLCDWFINLKFCAIFKFRFSFQTLLHDFDRDSLTLAPQANKILSSSNDTMRMMESARARCSGFVVHSEGIAILRPESISGGRLLSFSRSGSIKGGSSSSSKLTKISIKTFRRVLRINSRKMDKRWTVSSSRKRKQDWRSWRSWWIAGRRSRKSREAFSKEGQGKQHRVNIYAFFHCFFDMNFPHFIFGQGTKWRRESLHSFALIIQLHSTCIYIDASICSRRFSFFWARNETRSMERFSQVFHNAIFPQITLRGCEKFEAEVWWHFRTKWSQNKLMQ